MAWPVPPSSALRTPSFRLLVQPVSEGSYSPHHLPLVPRTSHFASSPPPFPLSRPQRERTPSTDGSGSDEDSEDEALEDPYDLDKYVEEAEGKGKGKGTGGGTDTNKELEVANKGMQMLLKMGWSAGKGIGKDLQGECFPFGSGAGGRRSTDEGYGDVGRVNPIDPSSNQGMMGLGKASQDTRMLDSTTLSTRMLESEKIAKETPDQRKARMVRSSCTGRAQSES